MAGVPAQVAFSDTYSAKDQKAALMMSVNGRLNHTRPAPGPVIPLRGLRLRESNLALEPDGWDAIDLFIADPEVEMRSRAPALDLLPPDAAHGYG